MTSSQPDLFPHTNEIHTDLRPQVPQQSLVLTTVRWRVDANTFLLMENPKKTPNVHEYVGATSAVTQVDPGSVPQTPPPHSCLPQLAGDCEF